MSQYRKYNSSSKHKWDGKQTSQTDTSRHKSPSQWRTLNNNNIKQQMMYQCGEYGVNHSKFTPHQDVIVLLASFENILEKLIDKCMAKYEGLARQCSQQYQHLKQILTHYPSALHAEPYFHHLHANSTDTKIKLLAMLKQEQNKCKALVQDKADLQAEVNKLMRLSKSKDAAYMGQLEKVKELEAKVGEMANQQDNLKEKEKKLKGEIKDKQQQLQQMQANKQNMIKDLNQIQDKMRTLNFIGSESNIPAKQKPKSSRKICLKIPSYHQIAPEPFDHGIDGEFYRFLLIQACTIEEQCLQE